MGRHTFFKSTRRFAGAPRLPCVYAAELKRPDGVWFKVGVGGNALGRLMSLRSEVKREHGAEIGRYCIFTTSTVKAAYEAETRAVKALASITSPIEGRREFFSGLSYDDACEVISSSMGPAAFMGDDVQPQKVERSKQGSGDVFHAKNFCASKPLNATQLTGEVL